MALSIYSKATSLLLGTRPTHCHSAQTTHWPFPLSATVLILLASASTTFAKPAKATYDAVDRIVALGDIHGDYDRMIEILELAELIDSKGKWIGKNTHLVQLGDIPDRGPKTRQAIDFLKKLEKSARRKKGRVHTLIGNHDAMNVYGDLRYVTEAEFKAFAEKTSILLLEKLYQDEVDWIKENNLEEKWPVFDETFKDNWFKGKPPGYL